MSSFIFLASDSPFENRPNPHDKTMSVNQALAAGVKNIPAFMLEDNFDKNKADVILVSDREVNINVDTGVITDGDFDNDFSITPCSHFYNTPTKRKYCAMVDCHRFTKARAEGIISYIKQHLYTAESVELWHCWIGDVDCCRTVRKSEFIGSISPEDFLVLAEENVWDIDYCYIITK